MKIIITENKLYNSIYNYFDTIYDVSRIDSHNPSEVYDDDREESENENIIEYFYEAYDGYVYDFADSDGVVFVYIKKEYYSDEPSNQSFIKQSPILIVNGYDELTKKFAKYWKEPMKQWFWDNYKLRVKTIVAD